MRIYNETTRSFAVKCIQMIRQILQEEAGLDVGNSRFYVGNHSYPISVDIFTGERLGFFDSAYYRIGINQQVMYVAKDKVLKDLLRHEIAHYLTYIFYGVTTPHGEEFHSICRRFNWPSDVSDTRVDIEMANLYTGGFESERIINKIKNLLKLAQSDNVHEAELATVKANKLLLQYNISHLKEQEEATIFSDSVLSQSRKDSKLACIYKILTHFMVSPIYSYGKGQVCLDVAGTKTNVELAKYVASFLDSELDRLWLVTKAEHNLKGLRAKNSFFHGVGQGYEEKMQNTRKEFSEEESRALVHVGKQLEKQIRNFMRLRSSYSYHSERDAYSTSLGNKAGRNLTINKAVSSYSNKLIGS